MTSISISSSRATCGVGLIVKVDHLNWRVRRVRIQANVLGGPCWLFLLLRLFGSWQFGDILAYPIIAVTFICVQAFVDVCVSNRFAACLNNSLRLPVPLGILYGSKRDLQACLLFQPTEVARVLNGVTLVSCCSICRGPFICRYRCLPYVCCLP
jgi:hypothetical protein